MEIKVTDNGDSDELSAINTLLKPYKLNENFTIQDTLQVLLAEIEYRRAKETYELTIKQKISQIIVGAIYNGLN